MNRHDDIASINRKLRENQDQSSNLRRRISEIEREQDECWCEYNAAIRKANQFMDYYRGVVFQQIHSNFADSLQALSRKVDVQFQIEQEQVRKELRRLSNEEDELLRQKSVLVREEDKNGR